MLVLVHLQCAVYTYVFEPVYYITEYFVIHLYIGVTASVTGVIIVYNKVPRCFNNSIIINPFITDYSST